MTVVVKDMLLDKVPLGPVSARVYQGAEFGKGPPVILFFHGGAFLERGLKDNSVAHCLAGTGAIVVAPDYNAPLGNAFPKPLEVGFAILSYLAKKRAGLGDRKSLLFLCGTEAGGNIAAGVALKARDHYANELDGQILMSPLVDPFMGSTSIRKADEIGMRERWSEGWSQYLSGGMCHPYAAPCLCSRLSGVAPALVLTAEDDPLCDETLGYADRLRQGGTKVRQHVLPAGTGWPSIYGGKTEHAPTWQESLAGFFRTFAGDISQKLLCK